MQGQGQDTVVGGVGQKEEATGGGRARHLTRTAVLMSRQGGSCPSQASQLWASPLGFTLHSASQEVPVLC
jgi:hypothetical protein